MASSNTKANSGWQAKVPTGLSGPITLGVVTLVVFAAGFGYWAATAPMSGAAIAPGIVQARGQNQVIQHLEGGIIAKIGVVEGGRVKAGDVVMTLDDTRVITERNRVRAALLAARAGVARAIAERDGEKQLTYSQILTDRARDLDLSADLDQHRAEFRNRLDRHVAGRAVLDQRVAALKEEIEGLAIQKTSEERKLEVTREELEGKVALLKKGLIQKGQVSSLQRGEADILGRIGQLKATIGQRRTAIAEIDEQRAAQEAARRETAATEINGLRSKIGDLIEQLMARNDVLARSVIRAPTDGVVVKLAKNTVGGIVRPGEVMVEILPTGSDLIIEARLSPQDIDVVKIGQDANLRFVALNARTTPEVPARVSYISADRFVDEATREPYYVARLEMTDDLPEGFDVTQVTPGMPVDAMIQTQARTFIDYLLRPIMDSFAKAFRED